MRRIKVRPAAVDDLDEHVLFISRDSVDPAMRLFDSAHRTYRQISKMPDMGTACDIPNPRLTGLRRAFVKGFRNYVVYYIPREDEIESSGSCTAHAIGNPFFFESGDRAIIRRQHVRENR